MVLRRGGEGESKIRLVWEGEIRTVEERNEHYIIAVNVVPWCIGHQASHFCERAQGGIHYFTVPWKPKGDWFRYYAETDPTPRSVYKVQVLKDGEVVQEAVLPITKKP